jgi:tripartite-type tricarboxylate transporter receptor subunit TctC
VCSLMHRRRAMAASVAVTTSLFALAACGSNGGTGNGGTAGGGDSEVSADYPVDRMTFVVPYAPGGTLDPQGRQFAKQLEPLLDVEVVVQNVPGAGGALGTEQILSAQPDGSTIGLTTSSALLVVPKTTEGVTYQSADDWDVLAKMSSVPYLLVVQADAPWETFEDFVEDAESRPGEITVSTPGAFNPGDLVLERLNSQVDDLFRATPFSGGGGEALAAVLGGQVDANVAALATAKGQLEAGELRALAIFQDEPVEVGGETIPAITEFGYDATLASEHFIIAPPGLPDDVLRQLQDASAEIVQSDEWISFVENQGAVPESLAADDASESLQSESDIYEEIFQFLQERGRLDRE